MISLIIGILGVLIILIAFALNLSQKMSVKSTAYLWMNFIGALMSGWYAYAGEVYPFVILEIVWAVAALHRLVSKKK